MSYSTRNICCPNCKTDFRYDYKDPTQKCKPLTTSDMTKKEKTAIYRERYVKKRGCLLDNLPKVDDSTTVIPDR